MQSYTLTNLLVTIRNDQAKDGQESKFYMKTPPLISVRLLSLFSSPEHEVLILSYSGQSMSAIRRAASTIALKAYSSYTPGPIDLILGRKHRDDL